MSLRALIHLVAFLSEKWKVTFLADSVFISFIFKNIFDKEFYEYLALSDTQKLISDMIYKMYFYYTQNPCVGPNVIYVKAFPGISFLFKEYCSVLTMSVKIF